MPLPRRGLAVSAFSSACPWPRLKSPDRKIGGFFSSPPPQRTAGSASGPHAPRPSLRSGTQDTPAAPVPSLVPRSELQRNAALLRGRSSLAQTPAGVCPLRFLATPGASCAGAPAPAPPPPGRACPLPPIRAAPRLLRPPGIALASLRAPAVRATPAAPPPHPLRCGLPPLALWLPLLCSGAALGFAGAAGPPLARPLRASWRQLPRRGAGSRKRLLWWLRPPALCGLRPLLAAFAAALGPALWPVLR